MRALRILPALPALLALLGIAAPAALASPPDWTGSLGGTFAISSAGGGPDGRGFDGALAAMWPIANRFDFGATAFGSDMGIEAGRLADVHTGEPLGQIDRLHRAVYGAAWRLDARVGAVRGWDPFASATWGFYSVNDELHGTLLHRVSSTGFSLGGGMRRPLGPRLSLGASLRYHRLFNDRVGRYMGAAVDWSWRSDRQ
jgi:hypothetical protein